MTSDGRILSQAIVKNNCARLTNY